MLCRLPDGLEFCLCFGFVVVIVHILNEASKFTFLVRLVALNLSFSLLLVSSQRMYARLAKLAKLVWTPNVKLLQLDGKISESLEGWVFAHLEEEGGQNGQNNKQPEFRRKQLRSEGRLELRTQRYATKI